MSYSASLQIKSWPPPAHEEFVKKGAKGAYDSDWNFTEMMIATSPFGDGRPWAKKTMKESKKDKVLASTASLVAAKFGLSPKAVLDWYQPELSASLSNSTIASQVSLWNPENYEGYKEAAPKKKKIAKVVKERKGYHFPPSMYETREK
jgi:hypothetical protein